jgi:hypothetical protein
MRLSTFTSWDGAITDIESRLVHGRRAAHFRRVLADFETGAKMAELVSNTKLQHHRECPVA